MLTFWQSAYLNMPYDLYVHEETGAWVEVPRTCAETICLHNEVVPPRCKVGLVRGDKCKEVMPMPDCLKCKWFDIDKYAANCEHECKDSVPYLAIGNNELAYAKRLAKVKKQPPDLTAGEFNRREC